MSRGEFERGRSDGRVLAATLEDGLIGVGVRTQNVHNRLDKLLQFFAQLFDLVVALGWRRRWWCRRWWFRRFLAKDGTRNCYFRRGENTVKDENVLSRRGPRGRWQLGLARARSAWSWRSSRMARLEEPSQRRAMFWKWMASGDSVSQRAVAKRRQGNSSRTP